MMKNTRAINNRIIRLLRSYTDDNYLHVIQNKHIKCVGTYNGINRSFMLCPSPSGDYEKYIKSYLNRFLQSVGCENRVAKGEF